MNVTLHEVARVLAVRNDISQFEDFALQKPEFDSRLIGPGDLFVPLKLSLIHICFWWSCGTSLIPKEILTPRPKG